MTAYRRTRLDVVVARHVVRALAGAVLLSSIGNLVLLGCVMGWVLAGAPSVRLVMVALGAAAALHVASAAGVLLGWMWAR